ncbi:hypothetical protein BB560_002921 [Smittium megazygosporum]|uniref:Alpha/beta hydrolase fold-3 domain-containing protein n=1 Tax=Smittium megazygosporum TaxID=133381 RepID=A0A2T9ZDJ4_9FUNG|nr:hypothetical protein BB560_002921 [Smittium megazygosporum]
MDAGFWTAMFIKPKPVRHTLSIVFSLYYAMFPRKTEEKVRKFRSLITAEHMRLSWNKATDNPFLRLLRWSVTEKLTVRQTTFLPNMDGDFEFHGEICKKNLPTPWSYRWWFDYDPSLGLEPGFKSSEDRKMSSYMMLSPEYPKMIKSGANGKNTTDLSIFLSGVKPALCYIMYAHEKSQYSKCKKIILNYPGGGFIAMGPPSHDDYLTVWAKAVDAIVVSVDYGKSPEYPYPYAIDQCFHVYKSIVNTNGKCIGLDLDNNEKVEVVLVGDSAGGNVTAAVMLKILESKEPLPKPIGLVFIYGLFDFDIRAWMTSPEIDMLKGVTASSGKEATTNLKYMQSRILEPKDHLQYKSPLALDKENSAYESTVLSWNKDVKTISEAILLVKDNNEEKSTPNVNEPKNDLKSAFPPINNIPGYNKNPEKTSENAHLAPDSQFLGSKSDESTKGESSEKVQNFLSMSSRFTYFSDMVLTPEMMRAMAILYIGPNNSPDFSNDYYLSPVVAPEELLAQFPNTYFMCGEKDPLVDDTIILAGRIRDAKYNLKNKITKSTGNQASVPDTNVQNNLQTGNNQKLKSRFRNPSTSKSSSKNKKDTNSTKNRSSDSAKKSKKDTGAPGSSKYKPYIRPGRPDYIRELENQIIRESKFYNKNKSHFYISDSSNPTTAENSESEGHYNVPTGLKDKSQTIRLLQMTKFKDSNKDLPEGATSSPKKLIRKLSGIFLNNNQSQKDYYSDAGGYPNEKEEGVWDLTAKKPESVSFKKSSSVSSFKPNTNENDANMDETKSPYLSGTNTAEEIEDLSSTVIKVKILKGMSHGFMQMGSILPEAIATVKTIGGWIEELFDKEEQHISSYSRCGSVSSIHEKLYLNSPKKLTPMSYGQGPTAKIQETQLHIDPISKIAPIVGIENIASIVSSVSDKVKSTLSSSVNKVGGTKELIGSALFNNPSIKIMGAESNMQILNSPDGNGYIGYPEDTASCEDENLSSNNKAYLDKSVTSPGFETSNTPDLGDINNSLKDLSLSGDTKPFHFSQESSTKESSELDGETVDESDNKKVILYSDYGLQSYMKGSSPSPSSSPASSKNSWAVSSIIFHKKNEGSGTKNKVTVDKHGNAVVTSLEMLRDRESHLIENLRK